MATVAKKKATGTVQHLTRAERVARGKAARGEVPLSSHGVLSRHRIARIVAEPPLIVPIADLAQDSERDEMFDGLHELLRSYRAAGRSGS
jgi:hypothetical protein